MRSRLHPSGRLSTQTGVPPDGLHQAGHDFPTADAVLLCCFGPELTGELPLARLRRDLLEAGFHAGLANHLIRHSEVLTRTRRHRYALRPFRL